MLCNGPKILPWGTPISQVEGEEDIWSFLTTWALFDNTKRTISKQGKTELNNIWWFTVWNALHRSINIATMTSTWLRHVWIFPVKNDKADVANGLKQKPYQNYLLQDILLLYLWMFFIFDIVGKLDTGL